MEMRVIVVDNDDTPSARDLVTRTCRELGLTYVYVHAPARNISIARNACIARADAPLIAFIDDDETASPGWLAALIATMDAADADIVFGPVQAVYDAAAPAWLRQADLHSTRPVIGAGGLIQTGYTCNVLFRSAVVHAADGPRFAESLGRSGGEDTVFFHDLYEAGARMAFSPDATVFEAVPPARSRMSWLVRRAFRMGQTHAWVLNKRIAAGRLGARFAAIMVAAAKSGFCLGAAVAGLGSSRVWRRQCVRAALHAGVVAKLFGLRDVTLY
jgi:succinoglycan biosynthesis protein ExoM